TSFLRQMELNADLVAVSAAGTDPTIDVLVKIPVADNALAQTVNDLRIASDSDLYSRDMFHHQKAAMPFLRKMSGRAALGCPPPWSADGPRADVFQAGDTNVSRMWATHPTNYEREQNAKKHYIPSVRDERSAWLLFEQAATVRERVTRRFYQELLDKA